MRINFHEKLSYIFHYKGRGYQIQADFMVGVPLAGELSQRFRKYSFHLFPFPYTFLRLA